MMLGNHQKIIFLTKSIRNGVGPGKFSCDKREAKTNRGDSKIRQTMDFPWLFLYVKSVVGMRPEMGWG